MSETKNSGGGPADGAPRRYARRLSDKILGAFHQACDQSDYEIAQQLLQILETLLKRNPVQSAANRRKTVDCLVAAHERLWHLRRGG